VEKGALQSIVKGFTIYEVPTYYDRLPQRNSARQKRERIGLPSKGGRRRRGKQLTLHRVCSKPTSSKIDMWVGDPRRITNVVKRFRPWVRKKPLRGVCHGGMRAGQIHIRSFSAGERIFMDFKHFGPD